MSYSKNLKKSQILIKANDALILAHYWEKQGNSQMQKLWYDEYQIQMKKYLGIK